MQPIEKIQRNGSLYGTGVEASLHLSLGPAQNRNTVRIEQGPVNTCSGPPDYHTAQAAIHLKPPGSVYISFSGGNLRLEADCITLDQDGTIEPDLLVSFAWPMLLSLQGHESLHGCVVERGGRGLAILGPPGSGKSTVALHLTDFGFRQVTDDLIVFNDQLQSMPGPPFLRLRPEQAAGRKGEWDTAGKFRYEPAHCPDPVELRKILVLDDGVTQMQPISGSAAIDMLIRNMGNGFIVCRKQGLNRFRLATRVAKAIPMVGAKQRSLNAPDLRSLTEEFSACLAF